MSNSKQLHAFGQWVTSRKISHFFLILISNSDPISGLLAPVIVGNLSHDIDCNTFHIIFNKLWIGKVRHTLHQHIIHPMDKIELFLWQQIYPGLRDRDDEGRTAAQAMLAVAVAMAMYSREEQARQCSKRRTYLVCTNLLPHPSNGTPWQQLYKSKSNHA
jgi:hypothetical protein